MYLMKNILLFLALFCFITTTSLAQNGTFKLKIQGLKSTKGAVAVALYDHPDKFLEKEFTSIHQEIEDENLEITFKNIPAGTYAISMFHDENNNKVMDKNFMGIPSEPYAFGNNARGIFGPPDFSESSVQVHENKVTEMVIILK